MSECPLTRGRMYSSRLLVHLLQLFKKFFETNTTRDLSKDTAVILTVEGRVFEVHSHYVKR